MYKDDIKFKMESALKKYPKGDLEIDYNLVDSTALIIIINLFTIYNLNYGLIDIVLNSILLSNSYILYSKPKNIVKLFNMLIIFYIYYR